MKPCCIATTDLFTILLQPTHSSIPDREKDTEEQTLSELSKPEAGLGDIDTSNPDDDYTGLQLLFFILLEGIILLAGLLRLRAMFLYLWSGEWYFM